MSEKRKAHMAFLIRMPGRRRKIKIELFKGTLWPGKYFWEPTGRRVHDADTARKTRYRLRIDGRWFCDKDGRDLLVTRWEFRDMLWKTIGDKW